MTANGDPCWIDLMTSDTAAARSFYGELFGWTALEPDPRFGGYFNFEKDGELVAGCMNQMPDSSTPDIWSVYLQVADAKETVAAAVAHGGQVVADAMDVDDLGTMAVLVDVGGAAIGMWQPGEHKGFGDRGIPGTPSWFELHTRAYAESLSFYKDVFGWELHTMSDEADFKYSTLGDEDPRAGVMDAASFLPEGVPSHWAIYFQVADADKTLARVQKLGGSILEPAQDTPYGRLATATDTTGARFKLQQPPA